MHERALSPIRLNRPILVIGVFFVLLFLFYGLPALVHNLNLDDSNFVPQFAKAPLAAAASRCGTVTWTTGGSITSSVSAGTSNFFQGAWFKGTCDTAGANPTNATVSGITVTVNNAANLSNMQIKTDTVTNCTTTSGWATTFGTTASVGSTTTVSGSAAITPGSFRCFYVLVDVGSGAGGQTLDISVNASGDFNTDKTDTCSPSCPLNPTGSTTITAPTISITGSCKQSDNSTPCSDTGTVKYAKNGTIDNTNLQATVAGSWTISNVPQPSSGDVITVFIDAAADANEAVAVLKYDGSGNITGVQLIEGALTIGSDDNQSINPANVGVVDSTSDEDIFLEYSASSYTCDGLASFTGLCIDGTGQFASPTEKIYILGGNTFSINNNDNVKTGKLEIASSATLADAGGSRLYVTGTGTGTSRPLYNNGGTISNNPTVWYWGDGDVSVEAGAFGQLVFGPTLTADRAYTTLGAISTSNDFNIVPAGASTSNELTLTLGGNLTVASGRTISISNNDGGADDARANVLDTGSNYSISSTGIYLYGHAVINANASTITLSGDPSSNGACFGTVNSGVLNEGTSTFVFTSTSAINVCPETYYNLTLAASGAGSPTYTLGTSSSQTITVSNNLVIGDGTNTVTVSTSTYSPAVNVTGNVTVNAAGTLSGTGSGTITASGTVGGAGTISLTGGTFELRMAASKNFGTTSGSNNWAFNNLTFSNSTGTGVTVSTVTGTGSITVAGVLSVGKGTDTGSTSFNAGNRTWIYSGNGSVFVKPGPSAGFNSETSTFQYTGSGTVTILDNFEFLNNVSFTGTGTYTLVTNQNLGINGNFTINSGATLSKGTNTALTFTGGAGQTLTDNTASKQDLGAVTFQNTSGVDLGSSIKLTTLTISSGKALNVNGSNTITVLGTSFTNDGTFNASTGTVVFSNTGTVNLSGATNNTTFNNFTANGSGATIRFKALNVYTFNGLLTLTGVTVTSDTEAAQWIINHQGTEAITSTSVFWSACDASTTNITVTSGTNLGNNGPCWIFPSPPITISGTSNTTGTVAIAVDGTLVSGVTASISAGAWSLSASVSTGQIVVVWIDGAGDAGESTAVAKYDGSGNMTGIVLNTNVLSIGSIDNQSLTLANLDLWDCANDEDVMYRVNSGTLEVQGSSTCEGSVSNSYSGETLQIESGDTLTLSGSENITTEKITVTGTLTAATTGTITLSGTSTPLSISGTFTPSTSTVQYTGTTATVTATTFTNLTLGGTGTYTMPASTITITGNLNITSGATVTKGAGTVTLSPSGTKTVTDNNATKQDLGPVAISGGTSTPKINLGSSIKVTSLTIAASHELNFNGSNTLTLTGSGATTSRPLQVSGTFTRSTGTVNYEGTSATDIENLTYNNLGVGTNVNATSTTYSMRGDTTVVSVLTVGNASNSANKDTFTAASGFTLTLSGTGTPLSVTAGGIFNGDPGGSDAIVTYTGTGSSTVVTGATYRYLRLGPGPSTTMSISGTLTSRHFYLGTGTCGTGEVIDFDTYDPNINLSGGSLTINANSCGTDLGITKGTGTWTLDGMGLTSNNATPADIGIVTVATSTTTLSSNFAMTSLNIASGGFSPGSYTLILTGTGTPLTRTGTFTYGTSTVRYTGNGATITAMSGSAGTNGYYNLELKPSSSSQQVLGTGTSQTIQVNNNLTIGDGTNTGATASTNDITVNVAGTTTIAANAVVSGAASWTFTGNLTVNGTLGNADQMYINAYGDVTGSGVINTDAGGRSFSMYGASKQLGPTGGSSSWKFWHLTIQNGSSVTAASGGAGELWVGGQLAVGATGSLNLGSKIWRIGVTSAGSPVTCGSDGSISITSGGVLNTATSTVNYDCSGSQTLANVTYNNLGVGTTSDGNAAATFSLPAATVVSGTLTIGHASSTNSDVLTTTASNYTLTAGSISITSRGTLTANASTINITGTGSAFTNSGTFTPGTSTVNFKGTGATTIQAMNYNILAFIPASGTPTYTLGSGTFVLKDLTMGGGGSNVTITAASNNPAMDLTGDLLINSGATYTKGSGTLTFKKGGTQVWTDNNGTVNDIGIVRVSSNGTNTTVQTHSSAKLTKLTIDTSQTFVAGSDGYYAFTITGSGTGASAPLIANGTFERGPDASNGSTITYSGQTATTDLTSVNYGYLILNASTSAITYRAPATMILRDTDDPYSGSLNVTQGVLDMSTNNSVITIGEQYVGLTIGANGSVTKGSTSSFIFKSQYGSLISDSEATKSDLGILQVSADGASPTTLTLASDIKATSLTIDASQTFAMSSYTMTLTTNTSPVTKNGTFTANTGTVEFAPSATTGLTIPNLSYYNLKLNKTSNTFTAPSTFTISNNLEVAAGTLDMNTNDPALTVKDLTIGGTLSASSLTANPLTITGNFTNNGTFTHNSGKVVVTPASTSTIGGSSVTTFYDFTSTAGGKTIQFKASQDVGFAGTLTLTGTNASTLVAIKSDSTGTQWNLNLTGSYSITYTSVKDGGCANGSGAVTPDSTVVDSGNNTFACWRFSTKGAGAGASLGSPGGGAGIAGPTDGLVNYWRLDDSSSTTVTDSVGSNNGTVSGATATTGKYNGGYSFTAASSNNILVSDTSDPTAYTYSMWVKPTSVSAQNLWVRTDSGGPNGSYSHELRINSSGKFEHYTFDGTSYTVTGTTTAQAGTWYHVTATAANGGVARLYVNGTEEGTPSSTLGTLWTGGDRYYMGASATGNHGYFNGVMDDVRYYNRALSATEVRNLYRGGDTGGGSGASGGSAGGSTTLPETFTASNGTALSTYNSNWSTVVGTFAINTNAVYSNSGGSDTLAAWTSTTTTDQYAEITITSLTASSNSSIGVAVRINGNNAYSAYTSSQNVKIYEWTNGSPSLKYTGTAFSVNDVLRLEAVGSTITLKKNGSTVTSITDTSIASGSPGLNGFDNISTTRGDNWTMGSLTQSGGGGASP